MFGFKRKTEEQKVLYKRYQILEKYIKECRKLGFADETILRKLMTINAPYEFLEKNFQLNLLKEVYKMPKTREEYEDEDADEPLDEEGDSEAMEEEDAEEESEREVRPEIKKKQKLPEKVVKKEKEEEPQVTIEAILRNHEARLGAIEASLYRLRSL